MHGIRVEGIILKRKNLGEADRILTVFSKSLGKISVLAKGVRRITSKRSGNVELLNKSILYLHKGKNFWILTEAQTLESYQKIKSNLTLSTYTFHILELVDKLTAENQENTILYEDLVNVLGKLEKNPRQILIRAFETKILSKMGFINFENLGEFDYSHIEHEFTTKVGGVLKDLEIMTWDQIENLEIDQRSALELERVLRYHMERVIEGALKSRQVLKKIHG